MDFALPADLVAYLDELDQFIAREIKPIEEADDNIRFFDHRREWARTDFENGGLPRHEWEALLRKVKNLADSAGHLRFAIPKRYGGKDGSNLWMAVIREHFASKGLGLHNDLQNEHSIVGNLPLVTMGRLPTIECSFCRSLCRPSPFDAKCSRITAIQRLEPSLPP